MRRQEHFIDGSVAAAVPNDLVTSQPIRLSFRPYGRREVGDPHPDAPNYLRLDGRLKGSEDYAVFTSVGGEEFILADGDEFAPSPEEWLGEEVVSKFDGEIPVTPPLADEHIVLGVRADDGNGYVAVGVDVVVSLPRGPSGNAMHVDSVSDNAQAAIEELQGVGEASQSHAKESLKNALGEIQQALWALRDGD